MSSSIKKIESKDAPPAIGPYSQAVLSGDFIFVSGQIPIDASSLEIVKGDIKKQTSQVIDNIERILSSCGLGLEAVVKVDVFLRDLNDFVAMNEIYSTRFKGSVKPARCTVEVSKLPKDARIELSCIAYNCGAGLQRR